MKPLEKAVQQCTERMRTRKNYLQALADSISWPDPGHCRTYIKLALAIVDLKHKYRGNGG